jgi:hypothetical protein
MLPSCCYFFTPTIIKLFKYLSRSVVNWISVVYVQHVFADAKSLVGDLNGGSGFADGRGTTARFRSPRGVAVGANGKLYVSDSGNNLIRVVDVSTAGIP